MMIMTAKMIKKRYKSVETATEAVRLGASDHVVELLGVTAGAKSWPESHPCLSLKLGLSVAGVKPFDSGEVLATVRKIMGVAKS